MKVSRIVLTSCIVALAVCAAQAEEDFTKNPGYFDLDKADIVEGIAPKVNIAVPKALLQMAVGASIGLAESGQPGLADLAEVGELIKQIDLVQVRVFEGVPEGTPGKVREQVTKLMKTGWFPIVKVDEGGEFVAFLMKSDGGLISGITGFVADGTELVFINLVGKIDAEAFGRQLGGLGAKFIEGKFDPNMLAALFQGGMAGAVPHANGPHEEHGCDADAPHDGKHEAPHED